MTRDDFILEATSSGGDPAVAAQVWQALLEWGYVDGFTPSPDDDLGYVYGIAEEERDEDIILTILDNLGLQVPSRHTIAGFGEVNTPRRIVQFIERCKE